MKDLVEKMIRMAKNPGHDSFVYFDRSPQAINHIANKMIMVTGGRKVKKKR